MSHNRPERPLSYGEVLFIEPYQPGQHAEWDTFVASSRNGTIFHTQTFLSYHPPERFQDASALIWDAKGRLRAVFPATVTENAAGGRVLFSHAGSTYGGLVIDYDFCLKEALLAIGLIEDYARSLGVQAIEIRHAEKIFHLAPAEEVDFALEMAGFWPCKRELSSAIVLEGLTPQTIFNMAQRMHRRYTKKALRSGVEVRLSDDYGSFHRLLATNLAERHDTRPTHTREEMERIRQLLPGRVCLFAGFVDDEMAAGVWLLLCNAKATHTFYLAQEYRFQHLRPLRAVIDGLIRWHLGQGYRYLNLGISTENSGHTVNWGLFHFKESVGARGVIRTTYRKLFSTGNGLES